MEKEPLDRTNPCGSEKEEKSNFGERVQDMEQSEYVINPNTVMLQKDKPGIQTQDIEKISISEKEVVRFASDVGEVDVPKAQKDEGEKEKQSEKKKMEVREKNGQTESVEVSNDLKEGQISDVDSGVTNKNLDEVSCDEVEEPVFDGTEVPEMEGKRSSYSQSLSRDSEMQGSAWPEKAVALSKFVRQKSLGAVSTVLRRLSGKNDDGQEVADEDRDLSPESAGPEISQKSAERSGWNPLSLVGISCDADGQSISDKYSSEDLTQPNAMKGRIIMYTRSGCQDCKGARSYLRRKGLLYVEINIDVYPMRNLELEKIAGSSAVPRVFFNEVLIGGLNELKNLEESGKLGDKLEFVITEAASQEAPLPPLPGEDDLSSSGTVDELALIVRKMKESITVKDRFYKMRRFVNCFLGSEAVDFLSEDQYLERVEAVEFGRKLADSLFFQHVIHENEFEDGHHPYRFLDDDPVISQCQNIPRGISELKPKPITEISSRLRILSYAMFEAYTLEDGKRVDYKSIHGSEEFARYLRIVEELQRVDLYDLPREEKLSFFINLYNMMAIHAILMWGHPSGALERRKLFGDFKYVIGGSAYSLSAIYNGILRGNQRPPYNLTKPFGVKDKRLKVGLPYPEPLIHFALVCGTQSGPALQCYSPGNIDKELRDAAFNFLRTGGLCVDLVTNVAYVSKILKWYSVDFGKNEVEVLKHAANYLEAAERQALLELLSNAQLKVIYQPYDWGLNQ